MKAALTKTKKICFGSLSLILFFALWQVASVTELVPSAVIPPPTKIFREIAGSFLSGKLIHLTLYSMINIGIGFLLCLLFSIPIGFLIGLNFHKFERVLLPFLRICEKLNPFALFPVFIILFGIGRLEKVMIVLWVAQWPLIFSTVEGTRNLDRSIMKSARAMGARGWNLLSKVIVPLALPYIFTGLKTSAQLAFFMIIASEMVGASDGLGWMYLTASHAYNVPMMYGIILYITLLAILINLIFTKIEKRFSVWKPSVF